ncbi:MAG: CoA-binding protein [Gammaproteobacteria bacterium]|nr:CoA-binding protein [Gammaproteobacteria bacterium]
MSLSVAIIGASHKPQRYSYQAQELLMDNGHTVFPVSSNGREILGVHGYSSINEISTPIDTVTLYLNAQRHETIKQDMLVLKPRRIIFNPGTESDELEAFYQSKGIITEQACTLVLLRTNQFE